MGKWGKYFSKDSVSTGLTFCESGNVAVFPATNVGKRDVRVEVECFDGNPEDDNFVPLVPLEDGKIPAGGTAVFAKVPCEDELPDAVSPALGRRVGALLRDGAVPRASSRSAAWPHICEIENDNIVNCDLTEALSFGSSVSYRDDD